MSRTAVSLFVLASSAILCAGCFSTYGEKAGGRVKLSSDAVYRYLAEAEVARPNIVTSVKMRVENGQRFRDRIRDQKNRWCLLTVWIERGHQNVLHVVTNRDESCPKCGGTGHRKWSNQTMQNMPWQTRCLTCDGEGFLKNHTMERKFVLSPYDFHDPEQARAHEAQIAYENAPPETQHHIDRLASQKPTERLASLIWLNRHYVRENTSFQEYLPMLRKARWHEKSAEKNLMVWQFHAGKDIPGEEARAYYRIYANLKTGRINRKGFYPEQ